MGSTRTGQGANDGDFRPVDWRERRSKANALYRQRKKAAANATAAALQEQAAAVAAERAQHAALRNDAAALDSLASYQAQLAATLQQAAQADMVDSFVNDCLMDSEQDDGARPSPVFEELESEADSWQQPMGSDECCDAEPQLPPTADKGWEPLAVMALRLRATQQLEGQAPLQQPQHEAQEQRQQQAFASPSATASEATAIPCADAASGSNDTGAGESLLCPVQWAFRAMRALQQESSSWAASEAAVAGSPHVPPLASGPGQRQLSTVQQLLQDASTCLAAQFRPPQWQMRLFVRLLPASMLVRRHAFFLSQVQTALEVWESCPAMRPELERLLASRFADRNEIVQLLVDVRPQTLLDLVQPRLCSPPSTDTPPSLDGRPPLSPSLLPVAHYLESILQPRHLDLLEQRWHAYQQSMAAAREQAGEAVLQVQWTAALHEASWRGSQKGTSGGGTSERAAAWSGAAESGGGLNSFVGAVAAATCALHFTLQVILTPLQHARTLMKADPYMPDLTQLAPWLLAGRARKHSATAAGASSSGLRCDPGHFVTRTLAC